MRIALATWNNRISPVFDVARQMLLLEIEKKDIIARQEVELPGTTLQAQMRKLTELQPQVLICGAISQALATMLTAAGIRVIPFTAGAVEQVIAAWQNGQLPGRTWSMPGCRGRRRGCDKGRFGHGWNQQIFSNPKDYLPHKTKTKFDWA